MKVLPMFLVLSIVMALSSAKPGGECSGSEGLADYLGSDKFLDADDRVLLSGVDSLPSENGNVLGIVGQKDVKNLAYVDDNLTKVVLKGEEVKNT